MPSASRRIQDVRWEPCPAMLVAFDVLDDLREDTRAAQLERIHVRDLGHFIAFSGEELPEAYQSPAVNLGLVCDGSYPEEGLEENPVTLQTKYEPGRGYKLVVFLGEPYAPSKGERAKLVESDAFVLLRPRRGTEDFLEREKCPPLETDWTDEAQFRSAVTEAVELFILRE